MAEARLSRRHYHRATINAEIYTPEGALEAGFVDRVVAADRVIDEARERARALAGSVDASAFRKTKLAVRGALLDEVRAELDRA
jgi:enoyl-CoA hydratase